jgi:hypothetical protein
MDSGALLLWGVVSGSVGLGFSVYGKKQHRPVPLLCGLALVALPYLAGTVPLLLGTGVVLVALPYFVRL